MEIDHYLMKVMYVLYSKKHLIFAKQETRIIRALFPESVKIRASLNTGGKHEVL